MLQIYTLHWFEETSRFTNGERRRDRTVNWWLLARCCIAAQSLLRLRGETDR